MGDDNDDDDDDESGAVGFASENRVSCREQ